MTTDLSRLSSLAGLNPHRAIVQRLEAERLELNEAIELLKRNAAAGVKLDEGLFTSLKAMVGTLGAGGRAAGRAVQSVAKNVSFKIREIYQDQKAKAELLELVKTLQVTGEAWAKSASDANTIVSKDPEVKAILTNLDSALKEAHALLAQRAGLVSTDDK